MAAAAGFAHSGAVGEDGALFVWGEACTAARDGGHGKQPGPDARCRLPGPCGRSLPGTSTRAS